MKKHFLVTFEGEVDECNERIEAGALKYDVGEALENAAHSDVIPVGSWKVQDSDGIDHQKAIVDWLQARTDEMKKSTYPGLGLAFQHFVDVIREGRYLDS